MTSISSAMKVTGSPRLALWLVFKLPVRSVRILELKAFGTVHQYKKVGHFQRGAWDMLWFLKLAQSDM